MGERKEGGRRRERGKEREKEEGGREEGGEREGSKGRREREKEEGGERKGRRRYMQMTHLCVTRLLACCLVSGSLRGTAQCGQLTAPHQ